MDIQKIKKKLLNLDKKKAIKFIVLYGSVAENKQTPLSDIDVAIYYEGNKKERFKFRIKALGELPDNVDLQIFQDLPLYVKKEVLSGKILFYRDYDFIFDCFREVITEFNTFEKYYDEYISQIMVKAEA